MEFVNLITGERQKPQPWQEALNVGDYYLIESTLGKMGNEVFTGPNVYGRIEKEAHDTGYFYVRGYSMWCEQGELGLFNICEPTRQLTEAEFETAREAGWP